MGWIFIGALIAYLFLLRRFVPGLFAPRCPLCGARLERRFNSPTASFGKRWHYGWGRFACTQCLYYHDRPVVYRDREVKTDEARALR
jgi:hypothetical protein